MGCTNGKRISSTINDLLLFKSLHLRGMVNVNTLTIVKKIMFFFPIIPLRSVELTSGLKDPMKSIFKKSLFNSCSRTRRPKLKLLKGDL